MSVFRLLFMTNLSHYYKSYETCKGYNPSFSSAYLLIMDKGLINICTHAFTLDWGNVILIINVTVAIDTRYTQIFVK